MLQWLIGEDNKIAYQTLEDNRASRNAVFLADALIKELKKDNL